MPVPVSTGVAARTAGEDNCVSVKAMPLTEMPVIPPGVVNVMLPVTVSLVSAALVNPRSLTVA